MNGLRQNIRFAFRTLLKNKGFTLTAILMLALGIGTTTAIFSVVYAVFEPMPYPNPDHSRVINQVLKEGTILAVGGTVIGLGGAYLVGRAMQSTLFGVQAFDVGAFGAITFLLLLAAVLACLFPAWRASRVEPLKALRYQ